MSMTNGGLRCFAGALVLLFLIAEEAGATHCYILRRISETDTQVTVSWTSVYQAPTPRVPEGYTIVGAWYDNMTPGGMNPEKCAQMTSYKARNDVISWGNPREKCLRSYYNTTLVWSSSRCGSPAPRLNSGRFRSQSGDSANITDLGGGKYRFEVWQGSGEKPGTHLWYNIGEGTTGSDGLIHCVHLSVVGHVNPHIITESYFKVVDPATLQQVRYRLYTEATKPTSPDVGWQAGPTWRFVR
jgi:hypothetical protein